MLLCDSRLQCNWHQALSSAEVGLVAEVVSSAEVGLVAEVVPEA